jgi:hypothetical protein
MASLPPWARYWLIGLGCAWLVVGWVGGGAFWFTVVVLTGVWGVLVGRKYANVTLEPWSKERGIVIWGYRKKHTPTGTPRLVWDHEQPVPTAPEATPAAPEATPASIAANERQQSRPLPFPPHSASTAAAEPAAVAESPAVARPKDTGRKICPDCAETVLSEARVCRYCGYRFEPVADTVPPDSD